jgi:hypothetical protein
MHRFRNVARAVDGAAASATAQGGRYRSGEARSMPMFFFFSNRLGCLGSVAVSLIVSLIVIAAFRACGVNFY